MASRLPHLLAKQIEDHEALAAELIAHIVYLPHPADMDDRTRARLHDAVVRALG